MSASEVRVGFTGGRRPHTPDQHMWIYDRLIELFEPGAELHLGDCVGKDATAWAIGVAIGYRTMGHPPTNPAHRAHCRYGEMWPEKGYLERDQDIVDCSTYLIAVPDGPEHLHPRSGTWATVRMARAAGIAHQIMDSWT